MFLCGILSSTMIPKLRFKKLAINLRRAGSSYGEIRRKVPVAKSTLSLWLKDFPLSEKDRKRLYTKQIEILSRGPNSQKERRMREIENILKEANKEIKLPLSTETIRLMGAGIYWAEGSKGGLCEITNSDPHLILFMVRWLKLVFGILPQNLKARLNIYPQQNETDIKNFWSELTDIPFQNFGKSFVKPVSKGYKKNNLYYGTMRVEVPKSVNMKHRIFGWISGSLKEISPKVSLVQRKWDSISKVERPVPINLLKEPSIT